MLTNFKVSLAHQNEQIWKNKINKLWLSYWWKFYQIVLPSALFSYFKTFHVIQVSGYLQHVQIQDYGSVNMYEKEVSNDLLTTAVSLLPCSRDSFNVHNFQNSTDALCYISLCFGLWKFSSCFFWDYKYILKTFIFSQLLAITKLYIIQFLRGKLENIVLHLWVMLEKLPSGLMCVFSPARYWRNCCEYLMSVHRPFSAWCGRGNLQCDRFMILLILYIHRTVLFTYDPHGSSLLDTLKCIYTYPLNFRLPWMSIHQK